MNNFISNCLEVSTGKEDGNKDDKSTSGADGESSSLLNDSNGAIGKRPFPERAIFQAIIDVMYKGKDVKPTSAEELRLK